MSTLNKSSKNFYYKYFMLKVLYSSPSIQKDLVWLPLAWGRFREYCDYHFKHDLSSVEWLDPIFENQDNSTAQIEQEYNFEEIDVLLLSFYIWNEEIQLKIAKLAKEKNPNILILGGGPQAQYKPWQETEKYEVVDYITPWEGEEVIAEALYAKLTDQSFNLEQWVDPKQPKEITRKNRLNLNTLYSPYTIYFNDFERLITRSRNKNNLYAIGAPWETNRGCPYKCSFCDWGSSTSDKIRKYSQNVVFDDIDAISKLKVDYVFCCDANFGIYAEDLIYAERFAENRKKLDFPRSIHLCSAKNKKEIAVKVNKILYENNMNGGVQIGFQHTDPDVLESIDRGNIKTDMLYYELEESYKSNIPMLGVVIIGNPGDTVEKWEKNITHMLELGFHNDIRVHDFMLLPNAPAAEPEYRKKYGIEIERKINSPLNAYENSWAADYIVATNTFTREDLGLMNAFTYFILGFHQMNITQYISKFLYYRYGFPYLKFYKEIQNLPSIKPIYKKVTDEMILYTTSNNQEKKILYRDEHKIIPDSYFKYSAIDVIDDVFKDLALYVKSLNLMTDDEVEDLIKTQRLCVVTISNTSKETNLKYNFGEIFKSIDNLGPTDKLENIELIKNERTVKLNDFTVYVQNKPVDVSSMFDYVEQFLYSIIFREQGNRTNQFVYKAAFDL